MLGGDGGDRRGPCNADPRESILEQDFECGRLAQWLEHRLRGSNTSSPEGLWFESTISHLSARSLFMLYLLVSE